MKKMIYAGQLRHRLVKGKGADSLASFIRDDVAPVSTIRIDGAKGYQELSSMGYRHDPLVLAGDPEKGETHLPMIHLVFIISCWV